MIDDIRAATGHGVRQICASLQVPRSSFCPAASPTATQADDRRIGDRIEAIFRHRRRRYGYRRIGEELSDAGEVWAGDICQRPPALPFGQRLRPLAVSFHSVPSSPLPPAGSIWPW